MAKSGEMKFVHSPKQEYIACQGNWEGNVVFKDAQLTEPSHYTLQVQRLMFGTATADSYNQQRQYASCTHSLRNAEQKMHFVETCSNPTS